MPSALLSASPCRTALAVVSDVTLTAGSAKRPARARSRIAQYVLKSGTGIMLGWMRSGLVVPSRSFAARSHEASIGCKICGISCWVPHDRLICDNHCCSWLDLVYELLGKLSV